MDIAVSTRAKASNEAGASEGTNPWFALDTILSDLAPCDACLASELEMKNSAVVCLGVFSFGTNGIGTVG